MDPQHPDRPDDERTVRPTGTGTEGGSVATPPSDRTEVLARVLSSCRVVRRRQAGRPALFVAAAIIGVVGALLGGFLAAALFDADPLDEFFDISSWLTAIVGSLILLGIYRLVVNRDRGALRA